MYPSAHTDFAVTDSPRIEDPLAFDREDDAVVTTTRRALSRLAYVAAETGARFEREGVTYDPMAWLMAPRALFQGRAALDACLELRSFTRAALLHGISAGLDALPEDIDALMADDEDGDTFPFATDGADALSVPTEEGAAPVEAALALPLATLGSKVRAGAERLSIGRIADGYKASDLFRAMHRVVPYDDYLILDGRLSSSPTGLTSTTLRSVEVPS